MKSDIVWNLIIVYVGIMLVFMNESTMPLLIRIVGIMFFVPAFVSLANLFFSRPGVTAAFVTVSALVNVGSMAFGLWLLFSPEVFEELFLKLIAVALFLVSAYRVFFLYRLRGNNFVSWKMYVAPLLVAIASVVLFFKPFMAVSTISIMLGVCAIFIGIADIVLLMLLGNKRRELQSQKDDY